MSCRVPKYCAQDFIKHSLLVKQSTNTASLRILHETSMIRKVQGVLFIGPALSQPCNPPGGSDPSIKGLSKSTGSCSTKPIWARSQRMFKPRLSPSESGPSPGRGCGAETTGRQAGHPPGFGATGCNRCCDSA